MKSHKLILFLFSALLLTTISAKAAEVQPISTITVQGASTLEVIPDQARISIGVTSSASTVNDAQAANTEAASRVLQKLFAQGIAKEKIRTAQYSISPIYTNDSENTSKPPAITSYQVNNTIEVTLDDIASIGTVIDAAAIAGANQISGIYFQKKDEQNLKQIVLKGAVQDATAKAEAIASALNKQIVRVITVSENGISVQTPNRNSRYEMSLKAAATPIQPGSIEAHGMVSIVFEIE